MVRSYYDQIILDLLRNTPGHLYVTQDGAALYALVTDPWESVLEFKGPDFSTMTDDDINQYIVDTLNDLIKK